MRLTILLFVVASVVSAHAQELVFSEPVTYNNTDISFRPYRSSVTPGTMAVPGQKMRNVGRGLTIGGIPLLVAGIALVSRADEYYYTKRTGPGGTYEDGDPKGAFGALLTAAGTGMVVTGVILWTKGAGKMRKYKAQQLSTSHGYRCISLQYRF